MIAVECPFCPGKVQISADGSSGTVANISYSHENPCEVWRRLTSTGGFSEEEARTFRAWLAEVERFAAALAGAPVRATDPKKH